jgi:hypothetical protein
MEVIMSEALFLKRVFLADAATCAASAVLLLAGAGALSPLLGLPTGLLFWAGAVLVPVAALFAFIGTRQRPPVALAVIGILGNILWVIESVITIEMAAGITMLGIAFVAMQAAAVAVLAALETWGLKRMSAAARVAA